MKNGKKCEHRQNFKVRLVIFNIIHKMVLAAKHFLALFFLDIFILIVTISYCKGGRNISWCSLLLVTLYDTRLLWRKKNLLFFKYPNILQSNICVILLRSKAFSFSCFIICVISYRKSSWTEIVLNVLRLTGTLMQISKRPCIFVFI